MCIEIGYLHQGCTGPVQMTGQTKTKNYLNMSDVQARSRSDPSVASNLLFWPKNSSFVPFGGQAKIYDKNVKTFKNVETTL